MSAAAAAARGRLSITRARSASMRGSEAVHPLLLLQGSPYVSGHFTCHVCWEKGSGPVYHCPDCQFDVHASCTGGGALGSHHAPALSHFSHFEHPLLPKSHLSSSDEVVCDCCGDTHYGSNASVYRCNLCDFDLCTFCVRAPRFLFHVSHPHILVLSNTEEVPRSCQCDGCGEVARGMMYRCSYCNFDLHVSCTRLPLSPMHDLHHDHPFTLLCQEERDTWRSPYTCDACGHEIRGWALACSLCNFHLHASTCGRVLHVVPRSSSSSHFKHVDHKVHQRLQHANNTTMHANHYSFYNPHNTSHSLSMRSPRHNTPHRLLNRTYSTSSSRLHNDPLSPHPHSPHSYSSVDRFYSNQSSPRVSYGESWNGDPVSSDVIANALSSRLTPLNSHDADALDRVMAMLGHNGSPPYS